MASFRPHVNNISLNIIKINFWLRRTRKFILTKIDEVIINVLSYKKQESLINLFLIYKVKEVIFKSLMYIFYYPLI